MQDSSTRITKIIRIVYDKYYADKEGYEYEDIYKYVMAYFKYIRWGIKQDQLPGMILPGIGRFKPSGYRVKNRGIRTQQKIKELKLQEQTIEVKEEIVKLEADLKIYYKAYQELKTRQYI